MSLVRTLTCMGYALDRHFVVHGRSDGTDVLEWLSGPRPTDAQIAAAELPAAKAARIASINAECKTRIFARWPIEKQISATLAIYGAIELTAARDWIDRHVDASNVASDNVDAATTVAAVEAVTVAWPA